MDHNYKNVLRYLSLAPILMITYVIFKIESDYERIPLVITLAIFLIPKLILGEILNPFAKLFKPPKNFN